MPRLTQQQRGEWELKIEAIFDMPMANQDDYGMLHVLLKDDKSVLINKTVGATIQPIDDGNIVNHKGSNRSLLCFSHRQGRKIRG